MKGANFKVEKFLEGETFIIRHKKEILDFTLSQIFEENYHYEFFKTDDQKEGDAW